MPVNNILLFDQNKTNMLNDSAYNTNQQRLNGVQGGIASSQLQNKFQYQVSLVAYAIASIMYNNGFDANDANAVTTFVSNMSNSLVQKVLDKASTQEAQAGVVNTKWMSPSLVKAAINFTLSHNLAISGNTTFSGTVSGKTPTLSSHLATKGYVDSNITSTKQYVDSSIATTRQYVDSNIANVNSSITNTNNNLNSLRNAWKVEKAFRYSKNTVYSGENYLSVVDRVAFPNLESGLYFVKVYFSVANNSSYDNFVGFTCGNYNIGTRVEGNNNYIQIAYVARPTTLTGTMLLNANTRYNNSIASAGGGTTMHLDYYEGVNMAKSLYVPGQYLCIIATTQSTSTLTCNLNISYYRITTNL